MLAPTPLVISIILLIMIWTIAAQHALNLWDNLANIRLEDVFRARYLTLMVIFMVLAVIGFSLA